MDGEAGGLLEWVSDSFSEYSWRHVEERFGAFHDVVMGDPGGQSA